MDNGTDRNLKEAKRVKGPKHEPKPESAKPRPKQPQVSQRRAGEPEVTEVKVLLLTFEHTDLPGLSKETEKVETAFKQLHYTVTPMQIPMKAPLKALEERFKDFLPDKKNPAPKGTLYIIYYHGHGYLNTTNAQFTMLSHNYPSSYELCSQVLPKVFDEMGKIFGSSPASQRLMWEEARKEFGNLQPIAEIAWGDISATIMDAPCNTLLILDCCNAGLASAMARDTYEDQLEFRKELLGACSWGDETQDRMSPALCEALGKIRDSGAAVSVSTLVRDMNKILVKQFVKNKRQDKEYHVPQAVHFVLERTQRDRIILNRLNASSK